LKDIDFCLNLKKYYLEYAKAEMDENEDPNTTLRIIAAYLERPPSDEMLRKEIEHFLNVMVPKGNLTVDPRVQKLFDDYLSGQITKDDLGDSLLNLLKQEDALDTVGQLPHIFSGLMTVRAIQRGKIVGVPGDLLGGKAPNELREAFSRIYREDEWYRLEHLNPSQRSKFGQMIGANILLRPSNGSLYTLLSAKKGSKSNLPIAYNQVFQEFHRVKSRKMFDDSETEMNRVFDDFERKHSNQLEDLKRLGASLDRASDEDFPTLERLIDQSVDDFRKKSGERDAELRGYARCSVRLEEVNRKVNIVIDELREEKPPVEN